MAQTMECIWTSTLTSEDETISLNARTFAHIAPLQGSAVSSSEGFITLIKGDN